MQTVLALTLLVTFWSPVMMCNSNEGFEACLPKDVQLKAIVQEQPSTSSKSRKTPLTVAQHLRDLKAHCKKGILVDKEGKEIRFVHLIGCWGNPPEDYQEQLDHQQQELKRLRMKYTVIEILCAQGDLKEIH